MSIVFSHTLTLPSIFLLKIESSSTEAKMCGISAIVTLAAHANNHQNGTSNGVNGVIGASNGVNGTNGHLSRVNGHHSEDAKSKDALEEEMLESLERIRHRGPDSNGVWVSEDRNIGESLLALLCFLGIRGLYHLGEDFGLKL